MEKEKEVKADLKEEPKVETKKETTVKEEQKVGAKKETTVKEEQKVGAKKETTVKKEPKVEIKKEDKKVFEKQTKKAENKTNHSLIGGIIIIAIIAILIGVCVVMFRNKPQNAVEGMLSALKEGNFEKVEEFTDFKSIMNDSELIEKEADIGLETQKLLFDKLTWNIKEVKQEGDKATIETEITNKDFKIVISNYMSKVLKATFSNQNITKSDVNSYLIDELKNQDVQTRTVTTTIQVEKVEGKWRVVSSAELVSTLLIGLEEAINSYSLDDIVEE